METDLTFRTPLRDRPYRYVRHTIYTAVILVLGSTLLISSNSLIGIAWLGMTLLEVVSRIDFEENLMLEYFGDGYGTYIQNTGRLLPRVRARANSARRPMF